MDISFVVKDFLILKTVKMVPEGITLIYGENGNGKSTLIKALVSMLSNTSSDDNCRHGTDAYAIAARVGDSTIKYVRSNAKGLSIQYGNEPARNKVGRSPLYEIEPRFPLKRVDYLNAGFFPNFAFQNGVPIFDDISVYDLFSSMFTNIAKISGRVTAVKNEITNTVKQRDDTEANIKYTNNALIQAKRDYDQTLSAASDCVSGREINRVYSRAVQVNSVKSQIDQLNKDISDEMSCLSDSDMVYYPSVAGAAFLFPALEMCQVVEEANKSLKDMQVTLSVALEEEKCLPDVSGIVDLAYVMKELEDNQMALGSAITALGSLPVIDSSISVLVSDYSGLMADIASLDQIEASLVGLPVISVDLLKDEHELLFSESTMKSTQDYLNSLPVIDQSVVDLLAGVIDHKTLSDSLVAVESSLTVSNQEYEQIMSDIKKVGCPYKAQGLCPEGIK
jgi:energy-coupling factor transporter ATP-binding protein EcfA2